MYTFFLKMLGWCSLTTMRRYNQLARELFLLEEENDKLIKDLVELQDENGSLWDMLDEIKKSDIAEHAKNQASLQSMMEEIKDAMTDEMLKDFKPVGEA